MNIIMPKLGYVVLITRLKIHKKENEILSTIRLERRKEMKKKIILFLSTLIAAFLAVLAFSVDTYARIVPVDISNGGGSTINNTYVNLSNLRKYYYSKGENYKYLTKKTVKNGVNCEIDESPFKNTYVIRSTVLNGRYYDYTMSRYNAEAQSVDYSNLQYVVTDDPIVNFVSKEYFYTPGEHSFIGTDYGCLVLTRSAEPRNDWKLIDSTVQGYSKMCFFNQVFLFRINKRIVDKQFSSADIYFDFEVICQNAFFTVSLDQLNKNTNNRMCLKEVAYSQSDEDTTIKGLKRYVSTICLDESLKGKTGYIVAPVLSSLYFTNGKVVVTEKVNGFAIANPVLSLKSENCLVDEIAVDTTPTSIEFTPESSNFDWINFGITAAKFAWNVYSTNVLGSTAIDTNNKEMLPTHTGHFLLESMSSVFGSYKYTPYSETSKESFDSIRITKAKEKYKNVVPTNAFDLYVEKEFRENNKKNKGLSEGKALCWNNRRYSTDDKLLSINVKLNNGQNRILNNANLSSIFTCGFMYLDKLGHYQCYFMGANSSVPDMIKEGTNYYKTVSELVESKKKIVKSFTKFTIQVTQVTPSC